MKPYPAVLREKHRYAQFDVFAEGKVEKADVEKALWDAVFSTIGGLGAAKSAFWLLDFDERTQKGILRTTNKEIEGVRASLTLIQKIGSKKAFVRIKKISGTIKKLRGD